IGVVGEKAVFDDVARNLTGDGDDLVTRRQPGPGSRRFSIDGHHNGQRHEVKDTPPSP
ncbi:MAG: hypothetical protein QOF21_202, partial [Actinomycetota bacterium]